MRGEIATQGLAEGFDCWQEHTTVADGVVLNIIEITIAVGAIVVVKTVASQYPQQGSIFNLLHGDVVEPYTSSIALILDVETKLSTLHLRCQIIHILHHQPPVGLHRMVAGILQRFNEYRF